MYSLHQKYRTNLKLLCFIKTYIPINFLINVHVGMTFMCRTYIDKDLPREN